MKNIEAWSFLVSCNLYIDYRTVIAPDFICDADVAFFLTQAAGENITKPGNCIVSRSRSFYRWTINFNF